MKMILLLTVVFAASCKPAKPAVPAAAATASAPAMDNNGVEKYVGGLQNDGKRAQEAREKANAAIKKTDDAQKDLKQAEGE